MKNIFLFIVCLLLSLSNVYASLDYELRESRKCSSLFPYFEKKYHLPVNSLHSISLHETAKKHSKHDIRVVWPWTVMNNKYGKSYHFYNQKEAIRYVNGELRAGNNNLDVGCMQINLKYHPNAFSSLKVAFNPTRNVEYGASFLRDNIKKLGSVDKAIGRYHSSTHHLAVKYLSHVSKIKRSMSEYKSNLQKYSIASTSTSNKTRHRNNSYSSLYKKTKYPKVSVKVGRIKRDDWFRKKTTVKR